MGNPVFLGVGDDVGLVDRDRGDLQRVGGREPLPSEHERGCQVHDVRVEVAQQGAQACRAGEDHAHLGVRRQRHGAQQLRAGAVQIRGERLRLRGDDEGLMPRSARWRSTWRTEPVTPFMCGRKDSASSATLTTPGWALRDASRPTFAMFTRMPAGRPPPGRPASRSAAESDRMDGVDAWLQAIAASPWAWSAWRRSSSPTRSWSSSGRGGGDRVRGAGVSHETFPLASVSWWRRRRPSRATPAATWSVARSVWSGGRGCADPRARRAGVARARLERNAAVVLFTARFVPAAASPSISRPGRRG